MLFSFTDGENKNKAFFDTRGQFPWTDNNPDNADNDQCVEWVSNPDYFSRNTWNDVPCVSDFKRVLCQEELGAIPTLSPTIFPSETPTIFPLVTPTTSPTRSPTPFPSLSPTKFPTEFPIYFSDNEKQVANFTNKNSIFEFHLLNETGNFEEMKEKCEADGLVPAVIDDREKYEIIFDLVEDTQVSFYFGLSRVNFAKTFISKTFENQNNSFYSTPFRFPWKSDSPQTDGKSKCDAVMYTPEGWTNVDCSESASLLVCISPILCIEGVCSRVDRLTFAQAGFDSEDNNYFDNKKLCESFGHRLPTIDSIEKHDELIAFLKGTTDTINQTFYLDLVSDLTFIPTDPGLFSYTNNDNEDKSFFNSNQFPWVTG